MSLSLCVVEPDGYGGLIHFSFELCKSLAEEGHQVWLVTDQNYELENRSHSFSAHKFLRLWNPVTASARDPKSVHARAIRIVRRGFRAVKLSYEWARLTRYLLAHRPDAVLFSEILFPHLAVFLWLMKKRGLTLAQLCHEFEYQERERSSVGFRSAASSLVYRQFDFIFFLSHATRAAFLARYHFPSERTAYIPHGSQQIFPAPVTGIHAFRETIGLNASEPVILFFGTIRPSKGVDLLIEAFALSENCKRARLLIAGRPTKYVDMDALLSHAARLGVSDRIIFHSGYIPMEEVANYFEVSRFVVLPYLSATQSGVLHLAYQFSKPVIATAVGGLLEDVRPNETGILVPPGDPHKLAAAIDSLIDDPVLAERLSVKAGAIAHSESRWTKAAQIIGQKLEGVVALNITRGLCIWLLALALLVAQPTASSAQQSANFKAAERAYVDGDYTRARLLFAVLAERGEAAAQLRLGQLYERGQGGAKDEVEARRLYTLAAKAGDEAGMVALAHMLLEGRGGSTNKSMARSWLRSAIAEGDIGAEEDLAASLLEDEKGNVPEQQAKEAIDHYLSAAGKGSTDAFEALAKIYADGKFVPIDMAKSTFYLRKSAESGDAWAMTDYAERVKAGIGEPKNLARAREWYGRAAELGNEEAQYQLALIIADDPQGDPAKVNELLSAASAKQKSAAIELASRLAEGVGGIRDLKRADKLYTTLAGQNLRVAHLWLAEAREEGLVGDKNPKEAFNHYLAAAALKDESWLSERIAGYYEKGIGTPVDMAAAAQWYIRAAEAGSIDAAAWLADAYEDGRGVTRDVERATEWARRAAEGGDAWSMMNYASALESGEGTRTNIPEALRWYEKAAQAGALEAELEAARVLTDEDLGVMDLVRAARLYENVANRGEPRGELEFGRMLLFGIGVQRDETRALKFITTAAKKGLPAAQFTLASLYFHGTDVARNLELAYYWWSLAAAGGDQLAKARLDEIASNLSSDVRKRLDKEVSGFRKPGTNDSHSGALPKATDD